MKHSRFITKIVLTLSLSAAICAGFMSCTTTKKEIPYETSDREIIQMAQDAFGAGDNDTALYYYETLLMRYGNDMAIYVEGRYEIAHIYLRQKRYSEAAPIYMEILSIYQDSIPGSLPGSFRKLAQNDLAKIPVENLTSSSGQE